MKHVRSITAALLFFSMMFVFSYALADEAVVAPQDFFAQMLEAIRAFGGLSMMAKISTVIMVIVSSMKVTFLRELLWSKLGAAQAWVAPLLGLIAGILGLGNDGQISLASVMAYVAAGAGAVILHELLDSVKAIPGIGEIYISLIKIVQGFLGGKKA